MGLVAFPYYGGKNRPTIQDRIISLFPANYQDLHYVEPCFGSGGIFFNKQPSQLETINDLDRDVVIFFETLRRQPENLIRAIQLTPWARDEFEKANTPQAWLSDLEQARLFYVRVRQGFTGSSRMNSNGWSYCIRPESRSQSAPKTWQCAAKNLWAVAERLLEAQVENRDALKVIQDCDKEATLFYIDPPYSLSTRNMSKLSYTHEMDESWHRQLAEVLLSVKGKVVLSGYRNGPYKRLEKQGWQRIDIEGIRASSSRVKALRTESLWLNYEPPAQQLSLFGGAE